MTLQESSDAKLDTILLKRFSAHLIDISNDIEGEPTTTPDHELRKTIIHYCKRSNAICDQIANKMRLRAIAESALTLPIVTTDGVQSVPTDTEIINSVNGYMATPNFLSEILITISI